MDFPTAWGVARAAAPEEHDTLCSFTQTGGALLCDCRVLYCHPQYVREYGAEACRRQGGLRVEGKAPDGWTLMAHFPGTKYFVVATDLGWDVYSADDPSFA